MISVRYDRSVRFAYRENLEYSNSVNNYFETISNFIDSIEFNSDKRK